MGHLWLRLVGKVWLSWGPDESLVIGMRDAAR